MIIRPQDKSMIISLATKTLKQPLKVLAYGSRVSGEAHDTSDLDLVLVSESEDKIDINEFVNFKEALQNSNIPILVQVLDWNRIPKSFHKNIMDNNIELVRIG